MIHSQRSSCYIDSVKALTPMAAGEDGKQFLEALSYGQSILDRRLHLPHWTLVTFDVKFWRSCYIARRFANKYVNPPIFVRKGEIVVASVYVLHRRREVYGDDAQIFRPERGEHMKLGHWDYLPFSAGPRVCPGQRLALTQVAYGFFQLCEGSKSLRIVIQCLTL